MYDHLLGICEKFGEKTYESFAEIVVYKNVLITPFSNP